MADPAAARAVWFAAARTVEIRSEPLLPPAPDEVQVAALVSGLSQGTERLVYRGEVPAELPLDLPTLAGSFGFPIKYGYALVGQVRSVGGNVRTHAPGDHVFVLHPHQSAFNVAATSAIRLPATVDPLAGVFFANLETALNILHDTPLALGETALVFGQGVVGLLVAQLLRRAGARRVLAVEPQPLRRQLALAAGVDVVLDPSPALAADVRAANGGRAPDVVVEASGAPAALQSAIDCVAADGTVVVASWYGTKPVALLLGAHFHRGRVRLVSSQVGRLNPALSARWDYARRTAAVLDLLPELELARLVTHRVPFAEAARAYELIDGGADVGQVVLTYADS